MMAEELAARARSLLEQLVRCRSITPESDGALELVASELEQAGFACERIDEGGVGNLWATHGSGSPGIVLCGHADVVPPGDEQSWSSDPFEPVERDGKLYGRGTTDMKGGLAALTVAAADFARQLPDHPGTVAMLVTSDEEGPAEHGVRHAVAQLRGRGLRFEHGLVGEPSSSKVFGDTLRVGRRGSLTVKMTVTGKQGHAAYPQLCANPIPVLLALLARINEREFETPANGTEPTIMQIVSFKADGGASNVIPGSAHATLSLRHAPQDDVEQLRAWIVELCADSELPVEFEWIYGALPYYSGTKSRIGAAIAAAAKKISGIEPMPSVGGGTSDGRFLVDLCEEVVEFGSLGLTMHQVDENIVLDELELLTTIYRDAIAQMLEQG